MPFPQRGIYKRCMFCVPVGDESHLSVVPLRNFHINIGTDSYLESAAVSFSTFFLIPRDPGSPSESGNLEPDQQKSYAFRFGDEGHPNDQLRI